VIRRMPTFVSAALGKLGGSGSRVDQSEELTVMLAIEGTLGIGAGGVTLSGMTISACNRVVAVAKGSSAEKAGLRAFDLVRAVDDVALRGKFEEHVASSLGGSSHAAKSMRLGLERPPPSEHAKIEADESGAAAPRLRLPSNPSDALEGQSRLTVTIHREGGPLGVGFDGGTNVVIGVAADSPAFAAGLRVGDSVVEVNGQAVKPAEDADGPPPVVLLVQAQPPDEPLAFTLLRGVPHLTGMSCTPRLTSGEV